MNQINFFYNNKVNNIHSNIRIYLLFIFCILPEMGKTGKNETEIRETR